MEVTERVGLVSVVVVNYNGAPYLRDLLNSLLRQEVKDFEIIIVDNNSTDGSLKIIDDFVAQGNPYNPVITLVRNDKNLGFARGANEGWRLSRGELIVFLNNDTVVADDWLVELIKVMVSYPFVGACQSRLIQPEDGSVQTDGWLLDRYGWSRGIRCDDNLGVVVDMAFYVTGSSFITRRTLLEHLNGFDEALYFCDFDLCWRMRLVGFEMATSIKSICYHYGGRATALVLSHVRLLYEHDREILYVLLKNYSWRNVPSRSGAATVVNFVEAAYISIKNRNPLYLRAFASAILWNLRRQGRILAVHREIQRIRVVSDEAIDSKMIRKSVVLSRMTAKPYRVGLANYRRPSFRLSNAHVQQKD